MRVGQVQKQATQRVTYKGVTTTTLVDAPLDNATPGSPGKRKYPTGGVSGATLNKSKGSGAGANGATAGANSTAGASVKAPINKAVAEKGWVSQLKPTAHNYHLKNLQSASEAATEVNND